MRVIAGEFRGRRLAAPKGATTRPTTDRVREALFSSLCSLLGPDLGSAVVLDPFAGAGALGIESLSRGARRAVFIERDRKALRALEANLESLAVDDRSMVVAGDSVALARTSRVPGGPFALILLDPPYRIDATDIRGFLEALVSAGALQNRAVVSWEHQAGGDVLWPDGFEPVSVKRYGSIGIDVATYGRGTNAS